MQAQEMRQAAHSPLTAEEAAQLDKLVSLGRRIKDAKRSLADYDRMHKARRETLIAAISEMQREFDNLAIDAQVKGAKS